MTGPWSAWGRMAILLLVAATAASAQEDPHLGYAYPAGGRRGTTCDVWIGGQYLKGVHTAHFSGPGLEAEVLEHDLPLTRAQLAWLRDRAAQLRRKDRQSARAPAEEVPVIRWRGQDLADLGAEELTRIYRRLNDPKRQLNPQLEEGVLVRVTLDPEAAPGARELRLETPAGLSNPLRFQVGQWQEMREPDLGDAPGDGVPLLSLPVVVNGQVLPGEVDRYRFWACQGQPLVAAVHARRLIPYLADAVPGWFQATLALYDEQGRELCFVDDHRFDPDPVLTTVIPRDGEYVLEIRDSIYRGREDFVYRMALGVLPFVSGIFPLGGRAGKPTSLSLHGWNLPVEDLSVSGALLKAPADLATLLGRHGDGILNPVPFALDTLRECREEEPNGDAAHAQRLAIPRMVNGRIDPPGDQDVYRIQGRAGATLVAEVTARRLGSPLDSLLELKDPKGRRLALNDDCQDRAAGLVTHQADSLLMVTLPVSGAYDLTISDAQHQGSLDHAYRLRISEPRPDFELRVVPSSVNVRAGSIAVVTVYAMRRDGFTGDIKVRLRDEPEGFHLGGGWIPEGQEQIRMTLTAPADPRETVTRLQMEGSAQIGRSLRRRPVVPADDQMQAFLYRHLVPAQEWLVAVTGRSRGRGPARLGLKQPVEIPARGRPATVHVEAPFLSSRSTIQVRLVDPPAGIAVADVTVMRRGADLLLRADAGTVEPGLQGNLIAEVLSVTTIEPKDGTGEPRTRLTSLGLLPAIPFVVVGAPPRQE